MDGNILFSSIFALFFGWTAFHGLSMRLETSKWKESTASVESWGENGVFGFTFSCRVRYHYSYANDKGINWCFGSRTNIWATGMGPSFCDKLNQACSDPEKRKSIKIYVNPKAPKETIIDNKLNPCLYSFLVFLHVGCLSRVLVYWFGEPLQPRENKNDFLTLIYLSSAIQILSVCWVIFTDHNGDWWYTRRTVIIASVFCVSSMYWITWEAERAYKDKNDEILHV